MLCYTTKYKTVQYSTNFPLEPDAAADCLSDTAGVPPGREGKGG